MKWLSLLLLVHLLLSPIGLLAAVGGFTSIPSLRAAPVMYPDMELRGFCAIIPILLLVLVELPAADGRDTSSTPARAAPAHPGTWNLWPRLKALAAGDAASRAPCFSSCSCACCAGLRRPFPRCRTPGEREADVILPQRGAPQS